jgi:hypothetical protein
VAKRRADEAPLFELPAGRRGRVETAVNASVRQARTDGTITDIDNGLVTLARALARAVDHAEATREVWALARVAGQLRETLIRLRLDPTTRAGVNRDSVTDFLRSLSEPSAPDSPGAATLGDPPHTG